ncbi:MAG: toll/interleukin-1 receptor domain-containing protein [Hyphomonadaceae bacterium]|nr:toll/interleukin-1 receptor domain-containing protein [Hyphomonadaceae bacterium]
MADIFVSYSRLDQDRAQPLIERLSSLGYSVWWDKRAQTTPVSRAEIEHQLAEARCVLTLWSSRARNAISVCAESAYGLDEDKLVQVRLDNVALPPPFNALPVSDLSASRTEWGPLEHALSQKTRGGEAQGHDARWGMLSTPAAAGAPALVTIACCAVLLAYLIAIGAAFGGLMNIDQLQLTMTGVITVGAICAMLSAARLFAIGRAER